MKVQKDLFGGEVSQTQVKQWESVIQRNLKLRDIVQKYPQIKTSLYEKDIMDSLERAKTVKEMNLILHQSLKRI